METLSLKNSVWHTAGGNNRRDGLNRSSFSLNPKSSTRLKMKGRIKASPIFNHEGMMFIADMEGNIKAWTLEDQPAWSKTLDAGIFSTPTLDLDQNRLFVGTVKGTIYALDGNRGEPIWETSLPSRDDPRILSDLLFLPKHNLLVTSSWGGRYVALDAKTGKESFSWPASWKPYVSASADIHDTFYCVRAQGAPEDSNQSGEIQLLKINPNDQKETVLASQSAKRRYPYSPMCPPVVDEENGMVCFTAPVETHTELIGISLSDGSEHQRFKIEGHLTATPAITPGGNIIIADMRGVVHCRSREGKLVYRYHTGADYVLSAPVCDHEGAVYVGDTNGVLHAIASDGVGKTVFEVRRGIEARPAFDPMNRLVVATTDGEVHLFTKG